MTISPTLNKNKNYLVKDGRITFAGLRYLKQVDKNYKNNNKTKYN